ncbi:MAG: Transcriptional regulatory protein ZraR [candidate division WS2 bacterium]|nr:Transcriptional regulatory protein ZraR [Candidatus Psychracetigena formicireducens]
MPVLITGESGSGKELVARSIHRLSMRNKKPFVPVNCAAIPETLLESELFGYEKGAFTGAQQSKIGRFEEAEKGTIFLDEIGDMSLPLQAKLLRVLQDKRVRRLGGNEEIEIDTRFIFATNKNISKMVKSGKFREDLYFRVDVVNIAIPPLRERKDDIPLLVDYFLKKYSQEYGRNSLKISEEDLRKITDYHFPGNVRELENIIARGVSLSRGSLVVLELPAYSEVPAVEEALKGGDILPLEEAVKEREKEVISIALKKSSGNKEISAKILKIPLRTLYRKIKEHGL